MRISMSLKLMMHLIQVNSLKLKTKGLVEKAYAIEI